MGRGVIVVSSNAAHKLRESDSVSYFHAACGCSDSGRGTGRVFVRPGKMLDAVLAEG
jgi:hypothetical protein